MTEIEQINLYGEAVRKVRKDGVTYICVYDLQKALRVSLYTVLEKECLTFRFDDVRARNSAHLVMTNKAGLDVAFQLHKGTYTPTKETLEPVSMKSVLSNMFEGHEVRTAMKDDGSIWFVLRDVCDAIGLVNHNQSGARLKEGQKGYMKLDTLGGVQELTVISEQGLYKLVFSSRSEKADMFQEWVASTVLPSIRKTGTYTETPPIAVPQTLHEALLLAAHLEAERVAAIAQIEKDRPKVEYYDTVLKSDSCVDATMIAKELGMRSAQQLNEFLHAAKVQFYSGSKWELYAEHTGKDYTRNVTEIHGGKPRPRMVWTEKGRQFIHDLVKQQRRLLA